MTPTQKRAEVQRVARLARGRVTQPNNRTIEWAEEDPFHPGCIRVRFAGWGLAPFREALYSPKEVLEMVGLR